MNARVTEVYIRQFSEIATGLPEEKLKEIITFARRVKGEVEKPKVPRCHGSRSEMIVPTEE